MTSMTLQEVVNKAVRGLAAQNWRRAAYAGKCVYRAANGARCAIGHVIPDEMYSKTLEDKSITGNWHRLHSLFDCRLDELQDLQDCHDSATSNTAEGMKANLREVLIKYNLVMPPELK